MISIYEPDIVNYSESAINAIRSGWISNHGEYVNNATNKLKKILGVKHIILMSNGTCATHCLFLSLKFKYPTINKIYVPNNCYVAAWNAMLMEYDKSNIRVMNMCLDTWNICVNEEYINTLEYGSAMLIVHNLGNIVNVPRLKRLRPDIIFIEDNCEGFTGKYEDIYSGTSESTLCSSVSFYANKILTTGEGGAFITNDDDVYNYISKVYSQGMSEIRYLHDIHAFNYRMTNIQAAFLCDQLDDIENILYKKKELFDYYNKILTPLIKTGKIKTLQPEKNTIPANWMFGIRIIENTYSIQDTQQFFLRHDIDIRPFFYPINSHKHLSDICVNDINSEILNKEIIMVPSYSTISNEKQRYIVDTIVKFLDNSFDENFYLRNVLKQDIFDTIPKNIVFETDNKIYNNIRINIDKFIERTIKNLKNKMILEIGPKHLGDPRFRVNNILETVNIIESNTTYTADLTKDNNIPNERFDAIYCLEVAEHTFEPLCLIKQLKKLLKPNGLLFLSSPFQFRLHGPIPDCYRISEYAWKYILNTTNFEIIELSALMDKARPAFPIHYTIIARNII